jgi:hypothetical protein
MGATTWRYCTPDQPFAEAAFRALRADVFPGVYRDSKPDEYAFVGCSGD